jgi:hypothetical protein
VSLHDLELELIAQPDAALVRRTYALVDDLAGLCDLDASHGYVDELYCVLTELFERHLPEAEWSERSRAVHEHESPELVDVALDDARRLMREREGARLIQRALSDG